MSRAALTFILYISTTYVLEIISTVKHSFFFSANQYASNAKRKTVAVQDIFKALQTNQFDMLVEPLQEALKGMRRKIIGLI
jgi:hypothetical protein